ncbi:MAG: hypothetical protein ACRCZF_00870, partial [Gemmataceae bacterium]
VQGIEPGQFTTSPRDAYLEGFTRQRAEDDLQSKHPPPTEEVLMCSALVLVVMAGLGRPSVVMLNSSDVIATSGTRTLFYGEVEVTIEINSETTRIVADFSGFESGMRRTDTLKTAESKGWFIVFESQYKMWLFNGKDELTIHEYLQVPNARARNGFGVLMQSSSIEFSNKYAGILLAEAPPSVLERLPKAARDLIPKK